MKQTKSLMGMHVTIEVADKAVKKEDIYKIFDYLRYVDGKFSTYKKDSEISKINSHRLLKKNYSKDMKAVLKLCEQTKKETNGYFDINHNGTIDPSGVVKGWAILNAAKLLKKNGVKNFYVDAGGDVQTAGKNTSGNFWTVGIRNPFNETEIVKVVSLPNKGVATSGTAMRGQHIYNPHKTNSTITEILSLTVIGPDIYEADRFATAAFAMGRSGIHFIEKLPGLEGYMIDRNGIATYTTGFNNYVLPD